MKKSGLFKYTVLIYALLLTFLLNACGSKSPSDLIVGQWIVPGEEDRAGTTSQLVALEFFSDGTYTSNRSNYSGGYSIDGDRIKLDGVLAESLTFTFELDDDTLTFYYDDGEIMYEYQRVE